MIILDTCALLWLSSDPSRLSDKAVAAIKEHADQLHVSAISAFEIGIKARRGALSLPLPPEQWFDEVLQHHGIHEVAVTGKICLRSALLPPHHADPCDRFIVATAALYGMSIVTCDALIGRYEEAAVVW